jgi:DNA-binding NtrC family response regulator
MKLQQHMRSPCDSRVSVLLVFGRQQTALRGLLSHSNWDIRSAESVQDALRCLSDGGTAVVLCPWEMEGGCPWKELLEATQKMTPCPRVIVTDPEADDAAWAEALNIGAYDVLSGPLEAREVFHVLSCAWHSWHDEQTAHSLRTASSTRPASVA